MGKTWIACAVVCLLVAAGVRAAEEPESGYIGLGGVNSNLPPVTPLLALQPPPPEGPTPTIPAPEGLLDRLHQYRIDIGDSLGFTDLREKFQDLVESFKE
eukprot:evm.model.scf_865.4 EVM.evm.TU.scf_865.4   scf_865:29080-30356(-)